MALTPKTIIVLATAALVLTFCASGQAADSASASPSFDAKWKTLLGEWKGQDNSGTSSGFCGFHFELGEHVIVRTNLATLPGAAKAHTDLMVISPESGDRARASYWDNEGHTIEYTATWSADGTALTFVSKPGPGPQFRLSYKKADANSFTVNFEMAAPGQSAFRPYASGKITRQ